jgi:hypothetical protein
MLRKEVGATRLSPPYAAYACRRVERVKVNPSDGNAIPNGETLPPSDRVATTSATTNSRDSQAIVQIYLLQDQA